MELNYPHTDINKLLKFSNKLQLQKNKKKLPKVIIIFNEKKFIKKKFELLKIPKGSAILLRSYKIKDRKKIAIELLKFSLAIEETVGSSQLDASTVAVL